MIHVETLTIDFENHNPPRQVVYQAAVRVDNADYPGGLCAAEVLYCTPIRCVVWENENNDCAFEGVGNKHVNRLSPNLDDDDVIVRVLDQVAARELMATPHHVGYRPVNLNARLAELAGK